MWCKICNVHSMNDKQHKELYRRKTNVHGGHLFKEHRFQELLYFLQALWMLCRLTEVIIDVSNDLVIILQFSNVRGSLTCAKSYGALSVWKLCFVLMFWIYTGIKMSVMTLMHWHAELKRDIAEYVLTLRRDLFFVNKHGGCIWCPSTDIDNKNCSGSFMWTTWSMKH